MNIHILDLDNVLHTGAKFSRTKDFNVKGFPTGGIYCLFRRINTIWKTDPDAKIIFVADTKNNYRKTINPLYKANRESNGYDIENRAVRIQKNYLIGALKDAGFQVFYDLNGEGLEADDLMFNIVLSAAYSGLLNDNSIIIESSDKDWVGALGITSNIYIFFGDKKYSYNDVINDLRISPLNLYITKACDGDLSDNYKGFRDTSFLDFDKNQGKTTYLNYWQYEYWEDLIKEYVLATKGVANLENMLLQTRMATPIFSGEIYNMNPVASVLNSKIDISKIQNICNLFRIKLFKELFTIDEYSFGVNEILDNVIKFYVSKGYSDVFESFKDNNKLFNPPITSNKMSEIYKEISDYIL